jgi:TRAP-type C4-dicarboxylate transport system permease small subunit
MSAGNDTLTYRGKRVVRTLGTILITACCLMVVLGATLWSEQLKGPRYVLYWSWCFLLLMLTIFVALLDMLLVRRASRQTRRQLLRDQFLDR